ncbi:LysR family transcriptional regulator [uncultured Alsobacter sp.]|uniref:LysR family transcriptional regulator n=1 Tax=uncultured Alsobacter sp. TaxID=1748258 RepID=UPI0025F0A16F|nr:LysR family transcriptional regulator [uncultured Alsobacter sp.]
MAFDVPDISPVVGQLRYRHLRLILALSHTRNMHRAAEEMNITQPAATKMLQEIESILGVRLFERTQRATRPNDIGLFVIAFAEEAIRSLNRFEKALGTLKHGGYGMLAIGAIMATAPDVLPLAIAELKRRRPLMTIEVSTVTSDRLLEALEKGELDLVIGRPTEQRHMAAFEVEPLGIEELWAFAAPEHPLVRRRAVSWADMMQFPWVVQQSSSPMRQVIDGTIAASGLPPLVNIVETTSIFATLHLVRRAGMVAILPRSIVEEETRIGRLCRLAISIDNPLTPYGIIRRKGEQLSENADEFVSIIREMQLG